MPIPLRPFDGIRAWGLSARQRNNVLWLLAATLTNSVFCRLTVFGSTFVLFLDHLGLDKGRIGLLLGFIPFAGLLSLVAAGFVARVGFRRAYIGFFTVRKAAMALVLLLPWVSARWGAGVGLLWVAGAIVVFSVCRAVGEVGAYALFQELVPNAIRGKFNALAYAMITASGIVATVMAGWALRGHPDTGRYLLVIGVGVLLGAISVVSLLPLKGGGPVRRGPEGHSARGEMLLAIRDANFVRYISGVGLANLAISLGAFVPLYLKESVGLAPGVVVWLDAAVSVGGLAAAGIWGRHADRRGSKPVLTTGLALAALAPAAMALPGLVTQGWAALLVMLWMGAAQIGWYIGSERYLFVKGIPPAHKTGYIAVYYSLAGLTNGLGPLTAGRLVEVARAAGAPPYAMVFALSAVLALTSVALLRGLQSDADA